MAKAKDGGSKSGTPKQAGKGKKGAGRQGLSKGWTWLLVLAVAGGFGVFVLQPVWAPLVEDADPPPAEQVALGATLFQQNCAVCHGAKAEGQVPGQPMGGTRADGTYIAPALNGTAHAWHHPPDMLFRIVKDGSPAAESTMKGWGDRMSDAEIRAVLAYVQSLWPPSLLARYRGMHGGA